ASDASRRASGSRVVSLILVTLATPFTHKRPVIHAHSGYRSRMEKDTEQRRAEIREKISEETGADDETRDPEGHEPLPSLVGNRIKEASEPEKRSPRPT